MNSRPPPEQMVLSDDGIDNTKYDRERGPYFVRDLIEPRLYVAVAARGRRRFYVTMAIGDWPEVTVDKARDVVTRIGELIAERRLIRRPTRRDEEEADMAAPTPVAAGAGAYRSILGKCVEDTNGPIKYTPGRRETK